MFTLKFNTENDAFDDPAEEIARILRETANKVIIDSHKFTSGAASFPIYDYNGNLVGRANFDS